MRRQASQLLLIVVVATGCVDAKRWPTASKVFSVSAVVFLPDGDGALVASHNRVLLWRFKTGSFEARFVGHSGPVTRVLILPDGRRALSSSHDTTVRIWDVETGQQIDRFECHALVEDVALSGDGTKMLTANGPEFCLWDLQTGEHVRCFAGHYRRAMSVAISPDGQLAASGDMRGQIRLWDPQSGKVVKTLKYPGRLDRSGRRIEVLDDGTHSYSRAWWIMSMTFSPDGKRLASGGETGIVRLWDVSRGEHLRRFSGFTWMKSVAFSPDGLSILAGGRGSTLYVWDVETGKSVFEREVPGHHISCVAVSPDGRLAATGGGDTVRLWDLQTRKELFLPVSASQSMPASAHGASGESP